MKLEEFVGKNVMFVCGAGLGVASGLPTYYGANGIYKELEEEFGMPIEEALSEAMFEHDPSVVWNHIRKIASATTGVQANIGHQVIKEICRVAAKGVVITQNVDGLQEVDNSSNLFEIHGTGKTATCPTCGTSHDKPFEIKEVVPLCGECNDALKPDVVLFGGYPKFRDQYFELCDFADTVDILVCVGTQVAFPYVAEFINRAAHGGGKIHWVDIDAPDFSNFYLETNKVSSSMDMFLEGSEEYFSAIKVSNTKK